PLACLSSLSLHDALPISADLLAALLGGELTAVVHQEAARARELVGLTRDHTQRQLLVGQVGTGQLEGLGEIGLVDVDAARGLVGDRQSTRLNSSHVKISY